MPETLNGVEDVGKTIFERHTPGRVGVNVRASEFPDPSPLPERFRRKNLDLPHVSELGVIRHYTHLSTENPSVETAEYPLGSCTMKYNPKINYEAMGMSGFAQAHPEQPVETLQGTLQIMYELQGMLGEIVGMDAVSLAPLAGAQGELAGDSIIKARHKDRGEEYRQYMLIPDSAHGTNPATAAMVGYGVVSIKTDEQGNMDRKQLADWLKENGKRVAGMMLTQPSTLGLFDPNIEEIADMVHKSGGLLFVDGANLEALLGIARFGDLGVDLNQINLHKTFSTPHGGGGPGSGPICVKEELSPYLPDPVVVKNGHDYDFIRPEKSIGRMGLRHGNFGMHIMAWAYIRAHGAEGLRQISESAVVNANYVGARLMDRYQTAIPGRTWMHEAVLAGLKGGWQKSTNDIAKRMADFGVHPMTVYFPLIVHEAMMIEPTESESLESLNHFVALMSQIADEAVEDPVLLKTAPHVPNTPVGRLDEATAARNPILTWQALNKKQ